MTLFQHLQRKLRQMLSRKNRPDDASDSDGGDALVGAPLRPRPHLNSGAIALEEPDELEY